MRRVDCAVPCAGPHRRTARLRGQSVSRARKGDRRLRHRALSKPRAHDLRLRARRRRQSDPGHGDVHDASERQSARRGVLRRPRESAGVRHRSLRRAPLRNPDAAAAWRRDAHRHASRFRHPRSGARPGHRRLRAGARRHRRADRGDGRTAAAMVRHPRLRARARRRVAVPQLHRGDPVPGDDHGHRARWHDQGAAARGCGDEHERRGNRHECRLEHRVGDARHDGADDLGTRRCVAPADPERDIRHDHVDRPRGRGSCRGREQRMPARERPSSGRATPR